jgi:hypothetical protein
MVAASAVANVTRDTFENLLESQSTYGFRVWRMENSFTMASLGSGVVNPVSGVNPLVPQKPTVK